MANELLVCDSAVSDLLAAFAAIQEGLVSPRDGQVLTSVAHRIINQLEPVMAQASLKHESRLLGSLPGSAVDLKTEYPELAGF